MTQEMLYNIFNDSINSRIQNNPGFISGTMTSVYEAVNTGICKAMVNNGDDTFSNKVYGLSYNQTTGSVTWYEYVKSIDEFDPENLPANTLEEAKLKQKLLVKQEYDGIMEVGYIDETESLTLDISNDYYNYAVGLKSILPDMDIINYTIYDKSNNEHVLLKADVISLIDRYITYYLNNYQHLLMKYNDINQEDTIGGVQSINF